MPDFAEIVEKVFWQFVTLFFRDGPVFVAGLFAGGNPARVGAEPFVCAQDFQAEFQHLPQVWIPFGPLIRFWAGPLRYFAP